jgi:hypothetical protein
MARSSDRRSAPAGLRRGGRPDERRGRRRDHLRDERQRLRLALRGLDGPDFDPAERAFYYARVLENPTCRWSTWECNRLAPADRPASCTDPKIARTLQERAWTSPIFNDPPA